MPANNIARLRKKAGMTQHQLAARMGIKQPALCKLENGNIQLKADHLQKLAAIFICTINTILKPPKEKKRPADTAQAIDAAATDQPADHHEKQAPAEAGA